MKRARGEDELIAGAVTKPYQSQQNTNQIYTQPKNKAQQYTKTLSYYKNKPYIHHKTPQIPPHYSTKPRKSQQNTNQIYTQPKNKAQQYTLNASS